jgi:hypothetical protein
MSRIVKVRLLSLFSNAMNDDGLERFLGTVPYELVVYTDFLNTNFSRIKN